MKKWTTDEVDFVIKNYSKYTKKEIAVRLDRGIASVIHKIDSLMKEKKMDVKRIFKKWEPNEIKFLLSNYKNMMAKDIATRLNRSFTSVRGQIQESMKKGRLKAKQPKR